jgi:hypothetical protein
MDLARVVLEFVRVLVWPVIVITVVVTFRVPLGKLLKRLKKASAYGVGVEFDGRDLTPTEKRARVADESQELIQSLTRGADTETMRASGELPSTIELAKTLALKEIASEYGGNSRRDVKLYGRAFDAVIWARRGVIGIDIKVTAAKSIPSAFLDDLVRSVEQVAAEYARDVFTFVVAIVTINESPIARATLADSVVKFARQHAVPVDVKVFDFTELKRKWVGGPLDVSA